MIPTRSIALALAASVQCLPAPAGAQAIERSSQPFPGGAGLPFAPAAEAIAPRSVAPVQVPDAPAATAASSAAAWEIRSTDVRLDRVLERWAQGAGWRLQWDAARHVELAGPTVFRGTFESAVAQVLQTPGIRLSEYPLEGCIYANTPRLMRITRLGDQVNECPEEYK